MNTMDKTRKIVVTGLLAAICIILGLTNVGIIPIPPLGIAILHIPVIIGAILEGPVVGLALGAIFGLTSMYVAFTTPIPTNVLFMNPLVSVLPRLIIPLTTYFSYKGMIKLSKKKPKSGKLAVVLAAIIGSFTNSVLVLLAIGLYINAVPEFKELTNTLIASANFGLSYLGVGLIDGLPTALLGMGIIQGIPEAIVCALLSLAIVSGVKKFRKT